MNGKQAREYKRLLKSVGSERKKQLCVEEKDRRMEGENKQAGKNSFSTRFIA